MRIHLISGPRNISTALMYSFGQRPDTTVIDEPFYGYYLKKTGIKHPGGEEVMQLMLTEYKEVVEKIILAQYNTEHVFFKNMAHHIRESDTGFMKECANVFLIRSPDRLIASFARVIENPTLADIGLADSYHLFKSLINESSHKPLVINSGNLLNNPPAYLSVICKAIGIKTDNAMLKWPQGPKSFDGVWAKYWYQSAHRSTGFQSPDANKVILHPDLMALYETALPYYNYLNQYAITI